MKFIVVTGADACGKDTQIASLVQHLSNQGQAVQPLTIWDSLQDFAHISDKKVLMDVLDSFLLKFEPHARSLFLLSCLRNSLDKIKSATEVVLFNGYVFKYWASEMSYGIEDEFWQKSIESLMPKPDQVFYLKTPLEQCLSRRLKWSQYEQGQARHAGDGKKDFIEFQKSVHLHLDQILDRLPGLQILDGSQSPEAVFTALKGRL